mmetsp:Transcript_40602/g.73084  ORF Transcript_40602/g.73084 Transcript_40602/m.73084 type:complete len:839 (+) Transcript_40602:65-2581(+)
MKEGPGPLTPRTPNRRLSRLCSTDSEFVESEGADETSPGESSADPGAFLTQLGEHIPIVSNGLQLMHELSGDQASLERARKKDPMGPNGYLTKAFEYVPIMNQVVQSVHEAQNDDQALQRARQADPIGTHGYITQVLEHVPIVSDGVMAVHKWNGHEAAAERARGYTLEKLLSKDGAITRVAELLPVSNLLAAAVHEMNGDGKRAVRALDLFQSWADVSTPDGALWQVAELLPGTDAVAFAMHFEGGHYAHALRSVTKVSWVNVEVEEVVLFIRFEKFGQLSAKRIEFGKVKVIPRQLSLVVGMSDLLTNFLRMDREGHRRVFTFDAEKRQKDQDLMQVTQELIKGLVEDILSRRMAYWKDMIPEYMDYLIELFNKHYLPSWRKESLAWRLCAPKALPPLSDKARQELQRSFPNVTVHSGILEPPDPISLKTASRLPELSSTASVTCFSMAAFCGLGSKVGLIACAAGVVAGAADASRAAMRKLARCVSDRNARVWKSAVLQPQPKSEYSPGDHSPQPSEPSETPRSPPSGPAADTADTRPASDEKRLSPELTGFSASSSSSSVATMRQIQEDLPFHFASGDYTFDPLTDFPRLPSPVPEEPAEEQSAKLEEAPEKGRQASKESTGSIKQPLPILAEGHESSSNSPTATDSLPPGGNRGVVLEIADFDVEQLDPLARQYLLDSVTPAWSCFPALGACLQQMRRRYLWHYLQEVLEPDCGHQPFVVEVHTDEYEVKLESYSFNLTLPAMRFALVFYVACDGPPRITRTLAALPDELVDNVLQSFGEQLTTWDLREFDPRFAGFTRAVHAKFDLEVSWSSPKTMRLLGRGLKSRLDLPGA